MTGKQKYIRANHHHWETIAVDLSFINPTPIEYLQVRIPLSYQTLPDCSQIYLQISYYNYQYIVKCFHCPTISATSCSVRHFTAISSPNILFSGTIPSMSTKADWDGLFIKGWNGCCHRDTIPLRTCRTPCWTLWRERSWMRIGIIVAEGGGKLDNACWLDYSYGELSLI